MAAYPTLPWLREGTAVDRDGGTEPVRASNGVLKVRIMYSAVKMSVTASHWLTDAQKSTLESFYGTNKALDVTLTLPTDGASYTVRFAGAPVYEQQYTNRWVARVNLVEV